MSNTKSISHTIICDHLSLYVYRGNLQFYNDLEKIKVLKKKVSQRTPSRAGASLTHACSVWVLSIDWTSDLQKLKIQPTKDEHPTYKAMFNRPTNIIIRTSHLQKLNIQPTKDEHLTYKAMFNQTNKYYYQVIRKSWTSDQQKLNNRSTKVEHPTYILLY